MELDVEMGLKEIGLRETVQEIHGAITEKFLAGRIPFDAWYAKREEFWAKVDQLSRTMAQKLREIFGITWKKDLPEPLFRVLEAKGTAPNNWEDAPDGALAALAIIISAWGRKSGGAKEPGQS